MALSSHIRKAIEEHNAVNARPFTQEEIEAEEFEELILEVSQGSTLYESIPYGMREISEETFRKPEESFPQEAEEARHLPDHLRELLNQKKDLYTAGNKTSEQMAEREELEAVLLTLQERGENMTQIARALNLYVDPSTGRSKALARALKRARKVRDEAQS